MVSQPPTPHSADQPNGEPLYQPLRLRLPSLQLGAEHGAGYAQHTMIHKSMLHHIFKISKLTSSLPVSLVSSPTPHQVSFNKEPVTIIAKGLADWIFLLQHTRYSHLIPLSLTTFCADASGMPNWIPYTIYTPPMAVIFKGSCVPLCSSPRTRGTNNPDLALLICG